MTTSKPEQATRIVHLRQEGRSQVQIARELKISRTRVRQILDGAPAGDRIHEDLLARSTTDQLRRHEAVLVERIRRDIRWLRATRDELVSRSIDEAMGLT